MSVRATVIGADDLKQADSSQPMCSIVIASTFTAEPVEDSLAFWMSELGLAASVTFAPYNQVFQQLLDANSVLATNSQGVNVVAVRLEDWQRFHHAMDSWQDVEGCLLQNAADLISAARTAAARSSTPLIVAFCPNGPSTRADAKVCEVFALIEERIVVALAAIPNVYLITQDAYLKYPVDRAYDQERDEIGHIPYTPQFYAALGTLLAREIHVLLSLPYKVIVLDCDNTIWNGVVGEDGVEGIEISSAREQMQRQMLNLSDKGFLLCLCSKNEESDVLDVFSKRRDMILTLDRVVSWRINWKPKSENIKALASDLNLGLDSFVFLDDNPVECAEVRSECPEVLSLQVPKDEDLSRFLNHIWAFDRLRVTSEDRQRTAMYKQEMERSRFQTMSLTIEQFFEGLNLQIKILEPTAAQLPRVAQLTQRTNQFNITTVRRSEAEVKQSLAAGLEWRIVEVSDRFGDYGLVGAMAFGSSNGMLEVDTFLLSCRVLNRGVEHRMLSELGKIATERNFSAILAPLVATKKNQPARDFLESVVRPFGEQNEKGCRYLVPAPVAADCVFSHASVTVEPGQKTDNGAVSSLAASRYGVSQRYERIANELFSAERVLGALQVRSKRARSRPKLHCLFVAPRTEVEQVLADLWGSLLGLEQVGIHDDFFELGGTSLRAVDLFVQINQRFGRRLPLTSVIEAPTIERFARLIASGEPRDSLVLIREGGDKPPLFLVHDGDGETMLYRNLAILLKRDHAIYGLQPCSRQNVPLAQTRISEMAALHVARIRSIQRRGPYLLGGMCAGGVIAFEIACQLQRLGEIVAMVALLDAADVAADTKAWRFASQRIQSFSTVFRNEKQARLHASVLTICAKVSRKVRNVTTYLVGSKLRAVVDEIRMRLFRFYLDRGMRLPGALEQIPVRTVYLFAEKCYQPESPFRGDLVLFRATSGEGPDEPYVERYADPLLGWGKRTTCNVRVCDVPGGHSSMLQEPHAWTLASRMQAYIDQALGSEPVEPIERFSPVLAEK